MATLSLQTWPVDGSDPTPGAADAAGDTFPNDGSTLFVADNSSGTGSVRVRFVGKIADRDGYARSITYTVPAGAVRRFGPLERNRFSGRAEVAYPDGLGDGPLQVAAARLGGQAGEADALPSPPALGANPGTWPITSIRGGFDIDADGAAASADGDRMGNDGETVPWIKNATGQTIRVWFHAIPSDHGYLNHEHIEIPDGQTARSLTPSRDQFGGRVATTYSDVNDAPLSSVAGITILGVRNASF